jgi:hypothetical protein
MMYERICTKTPLPTYDQLREFIGEKSVKVFDRLVSFLDDHYNCERDIYYGGMSYGVMVRYRKNGKTLVGIFPEKDGFSITLVYGKDEVDLFNSRREEFSDYIKGIHDGTKHYHDGRWMLIRMENGKHLQEVIQMIAIKKLPNRKKQTVEK